MGRNSGRLRKQINMMRSIIEQYGLGAISIARLFGEMVEPPREIIDVEYEDLSEQIETKAIQPQEPKLLETNKQKGYADSDNKSLL